MLQPTALSREIKEVCSHIRSCSTWIGLQEAALGNRCYQRRKDSNTIEYAVLSSLHQRTQSSSYPLEQQTPLAVAYFWRAIPQLGCIRFLQDCVG